MTEYFAFYGTLMRSLQHPDAPDPLGESLTAFECPCLIAGRLRDHGRYPGFVPRCSMAPSLSRPASSEAPVGDLVKGELHRILRPEAFAVFDDYERYDPNDEAGSLYVRRKLILVEPEIEAWVYVSQVSDSDPVVTGGDWAAHVAGETDCGFPAKRRATTIPQ